MLPQAECLNVAGGKVGRRWHFSTLGACHPVDNPTHNFVFPGSYISYAAQVWAASCAVAAYAIGIDDRRETGGIRKCRISANCFASIEIGFVVVIARVQ